MHGTTHSMHAYTHTLKHSHTQSSLFHSLILQPVQFVMNGSVFSMEPFLCVCGLREQLVVRILPGKE